MKCCKLIIKDIDGTVMGVKEWSLCFQSLSICQKRMPTENKSLFRPVSRHDDPRSKSAGLQVLSTERNKHEKLVRYWKKKRSRVQQHASTWRLDWSNFLVSLAKSSGSLHGIGRFQLLLQPLKLFRCCCLVTRPWLGANIKTCTMPQYLVNSLVLRDWSSVYQVYGYISTPESLWCSQPLVRKFYMYMPKTSDSYDDLLWICCCVLFPKTNMAHYVKTPLWRRCPQINHSIRPQPGLVKHSKSLVLVSNHLISVVLFKSPFYTRVAMSSNG